MTQFRYRLQTLFDQRERAKKRAQQAFADAQRQVRVEQQELEACRRDQEDSADRLRHARVERVSPAIHGSTGELLRVQRDYIGRLQDEWRGASDATSTQEVTVDEAEEDVAASREMLAFTSRKLEVLEKHRARLEGRFKDEVKRKDAIDQEEMGTIIFLQRRRAT